MQKIRLVDEDVILPLTIIDTDVLQVHVSPIRTKFYLPLAFCYSGGYGRLTYIRIANGKPNTHNLDTLISR